MTIKKMISKNKQTKVLISLGILLMFGLGSSPALSLSADERGARLLEVQLQRARHLRELEYQAEVLERQARIAKAQEQIDTRIGLEIFKSETADNLKPTPNAHQIALPRITELVNDAVVLEYTSGSRQRARVGDLLQTGHTVAKISMSEGVTLQKGQSQTLLNFEW